MASLAAHLAGDHEDALPFNPSCPICRTERLAGHLPATRIVSDRMRAGLVTGVLAVSVAVPAGTVGAAPAAAQSAEEETDELDEVVGDDLTPEELAELEALLGEGEPPAPPAEPEAAEPADPVEPVEAVEPAPVAPVPATPAPSPAPQRAPAPAPAPAPVAQPDRADRPTLRRTAIERAAPKHVARTPAVPASRPVQAQTTPVKPAPVHVGGPRYRVGAGDSLWSIARARLGRSTTAGEVAAEVQRLWNLNRAEIATGSPNLIHPGTWLVLR